MLRTRLLTVAVLIPAVLAALFLLPSLLFAGVVLVVIGAAAHEWARLAGMARNGAAWYVAGIVLVGIGMLAAGHMAMVWPAIVSIGCGAAALFWMTLAPAWVIGRWPTQRRLPMAILGGVVLLGAWIALVELQARSAWLVLAAMATVWIADTAAYFAGRAFGRRRLAPQVSPGKTWEGVYGAWIAVVLYALVLVLLARKAGLSVAVGPVVIVMWLAFMLFVASVSVVGDLFESLLKRHAGVKDSGALLPGHGGVLDRTDALLAAMPFTALAAHAFLARPA